MFFGGVAKNSQHKGEVEQLTQEKIEVESQVETLESELQVIEKERDELEKAKEQLEKEHEELKISKAKPRVASVATTSSNSCVEAMKKYFPQSQWENASLVIKKESGGRPNAVSATDDHGCFQIHRGLSTHGQKIYDADFNSKLAYEHYYVNRGWTPWYAVRGILW